MRRGVSHTVERWLLARKKAADNLGLGMLLRTVIVSLISLLVTTSLADQKGKRGGDVLGACATFAADGRSAAVTFDATDVSLDIVDPAGKSSHLSLPLRYKTQITNRSLYGGSFNPSACDAYFDREGDLVAIDIDNLEVGVACENDEVGWRLGGS